MYLRCLSDCLPSSLLTNSKHEPIFEHLKVFNTKCYLLALCIKRIKHSIESSHQKQQSIYRTITFVHQCNLVYFRWSSYGVYNSSVQTQRFLWKSYQNIRIIGHFLILSKSKIKSGQWEKVFQPKLKEPFRALIWARFEFVKYNWL